MIVGDDKAVAGDEKSRSERDAGIGRVLSAGGGGAPNLRAGGSAGRRGSSAALVSATLTRTPTTAGFTRSITSAKPIGAGAPMASTSAACTRDGTNAAMIAQPRSTCAKTLAAACAALLFSTMFPFRSVSFASAFPSGSGVRLVRLVRSHPTAARSRRTRAERAIGALDLAQTSISSLPGVNGAARPGTDHVGGAKQALASRGAAEG